MHGPRAQRAAQHRGLDAHQVAPAAAIDQDARVVVVSTGGLSHQLHGPDFGFTNPQWDNRFMDLLVSEPQVLCQATHEDFMLRGGVESVEMMIWLAMRGALAEHATQFQQIQRHYWAPMLTGYGLLALEALPVS